MIFSRALLALFQYFFYLIPRICGSNTNNDSVTKSPDQINQESTIAYTKSPSFPHINRAFSTNQDLIYAKFKIVSRSIGLIPSKITRVFCGSDSFLDAAFFGYSSYLVRNYFQSPNIFESKQSIDAFNLIMDALHSIQLDSLPLLTNFDRYNRNEKNEGMKLVNVSIYFVLSLVAHASKTNCELDMSHLSSSIQECLNNCTTNASFNSISQQVIQILIQHYNLSISTNACASPSNFGFSYSLVNLVFVEWRNDSTNKSLFQSFWNEIIKNQDTSTSIALSVLYQRKLSNICLNITQITSPEFIPSAIQVLADFIELFQDVIQTPFPTLPLSQSIQIYTNMIVAIESVISNQSIKEALLKCTLQLRENFVNQCCYFAFVVLKKYSINRELNEKWVKSSQELFQSFSLITKISHLIKQLENNYQIQPIESALTEIQPAFLFTSVETTITQQLKAYLDNKQIIVGNLDKLDIELIFAMNEFIINSNPSNAKLRKASSFIRENRKKLVIYNSGRFFVDNCLKFSSNEKIPFYCFYGEYLYLKYCLDFPIKS